MARLVVIFLITLLSAATYAQSAEQGVLDLSRKKFDWLITGQADSLEKLLDGRIQYIHSNGWIQNKREVLDDMRAGKLVYKKITVKEASARVYGKAAILTGLGTFEGVNGGTPFLLDLRYTEVYVWTSNRWTLASRHSNRMP